MKNELNEFVLTITALTVRVDALKAALSDDQLKIYQQVIHAKKKEILLNEKLSAGLEEVVDRLFQ